MFSYYKSYVSLKNINYFSLAELSLLHEDHFWNNVTDYEL